MQHTQSTYHCVPGHRDSSLFHIVEGRLDDRGRAIIDRRSTTREVGRIFTEKRVSTTYYLPSKKDMRD